MTVLNDDEYSLDDQDSINLLSFWVKNNAIELEVHVKSIFIEAIVLHLIICQFQAGHSFERL